MEGHAISTEAGKLSCKKIIHAVGPIWKGGAFGEADTLYDCIFSHLLRIALKESLCSIAIPAVSAGVFGFPLQVSTSTIVEAMKDFLDEMPSKGLLSEIHFVDNRHEVAQAFVNAVNKHFKNQQLTVLPRKLAKYTDSPEGKTLKILITVSHIDLFALTDLDCESKISLMLDKLSSVDMSSSAVNNSCRFIAILRLRLFLLSVNKPSLKCHFVWYFRRNYMWVIFKYGWNCDSVLT